jgi:transposase InsO family protein
MVAFTDQHKEAYGVEPMCSVLPIAPATYYEHARRRREPDRRPARQKRDEELRAEVGRVHRENLSVYGATKVWRQLKREDIPVARCTVERLMGEMDLCGAIRGRAFKVTTVANDAHPRPLDLVGREFVAERSFPSPFAYSRCAALLVQRPTCAARPSPSARFILLRRHTTRPMSARPTNEEAYLALAEFGGHLRSNGPPGWMVLGRALERLLLLELGWIDKEASAGDPIND